MDFPTFSLPSEETCPNATPHCKKYCYAKKAERIYKNTRKSRKENYDISKTDYFFGEMFFLLRDNKSEYIRVHESGDMYSQEYLDKWIKLMKCFGEKKFLIYTQMYNLDWSRAPDNCIIYWTVWDDSKNVPKDGLHAYVIDDGTGKIATKDVPNTFKCPKGKGKSVKCNDCMYCYKGKGDVKFKIH